jgi:hypothetical protein
MSNILELKELFKNSFKSHLFKLTNSPLKIDKTNISTFFDNKILYKAPYQGHGGGFVYIFEYYNKKYVIKYFKNEYNLCYESTIIKKIGKLQESKEIPDLYVKFHHLFGLKKYSYIAIMDYIDYPNWDIVESKKARKIKSLFLQMLIATWFLNHIVKIYHGDLCLNHGRKKNLKLRGLHNVMYDKVKKKQVSFMIDNKEIKFPNEGIKISVIDFGQSCSKSKSVRYTILSDMLEKVYHKIISFNPNHLFSMKPFNKLPIHSELLYIVYCLLKTYKFKKVESKLYKYTINLLDKCEKKTSRIFDLKLIEDMNENFYKFMKSYDYRWPKNIKTYYKN